jgi:hypothetical protein
MVAAGGSDVCYGAGGGPYRNHDAVEAVTPRRWRTRAPHPNGLKTAIATPAGWPRHSQLVVVQLTPRSTSYTLPMKPRRFIRVGALGTLVTEGLIAAPKLAARCLFLKRN